MTPEQWNRIDRVWHAVLSRPESERNSLIEELCSNDPELRREIVSMLANLARADAAGFGDPEDMAAVPIRPGSRLGRYEVQVAIGAGGMGEVYRARDSRLGRDVAIKVLPAAVAGDPDRLDRFEREARAAAALNHPNILAVHDFGTERLSVTPGTAESDVSFIVTELLEGRTLRQLLLEEKLSTSRVIDLASQIADGLAAAHSRGIVHRDLKPENLFVTRDGHVKILDFGLAKASAADAPGPAHVTAATTQQGTASQGILGTPGYMAPEQVRGQQVDHRSDIFVFGAVLYEMLTGRRAFAGETALDMMSAILREGPAALLSTSFSTIPPALVRIVERCLEKLPADRFQSTTDLAFALRALTPRDLTVPSADSVRRSQGAGLLRRVIPGLFAAVLIVFVIAWQPWRRSTSELNTASVALVSDAPRAASASQPVAVSPPAAPTASAFPPPPSDVMPPVITSPINFPAGVTISPTTSSYGPAISPDGTRFVIAARSEGSPLQLWLYTLESGVPRALPGTETLRSGENRAGRGPELAFWSPDGKEVAFANNGKLKRINVDTLVVKPICDIPRNNFQGGTWGPDGTIVFADPPGGLRRVRAGDGASEVFTKADVQRREAHMHPAFLPDGRHFVFQIGPERSLAIGSLDRADYDVLGWTDSHIAYASGYLLYVQSQQLLAHAFDLQTLRLIGKPVAIADDVLTQESNGRSTFAVSSNGVLIFRSGPQGGRTQLAWFTRSDKKLERIERVLPDAYIGFDLLGDDRHVVTQLHTSDGTGNLWLINLEDGGRRPLTEDPKSRDFNIRISRENNDEFMWFRPALNTVFLMPWNGERPQRVFHKPAATITALTDWTKHWVLETRKDEKGISDIWYVPLGEPDNAIRYEQNPAVERDAVLSPDERWMAYVAENPGGSGVVVRSFPSNQGNWFIENSAGARDLAFSADGKELFFSQGKGLGITAIEIKASEHTFDFAPPQRVPIPEANLNRGFAVTRDGRRFLVSLSGVAMTSSEGPSQGKFTVITNWTSLVHAR